MGDRMQNVRFGVTRDGRLATRFAGHTGSLPYPPVALSYVPGRCRLPFPKVLPGRCELARRRSLWRDGCLPRGTGEVLSTAAAVRASDVVRRATPLVCTPKVPGTIRKRALASARGRRPHLPAARAYARSWDAENEKNESYRHCWRGDRAAATAGPAAYRTGVRTAAAGARPWRPWCGAWGAVPVPAARTGRLPS
jgi:hypothetical protein